MIAILTIEQKDLLVGQLYNTNSYFNPIQDIDDNWIISEEEVNQTNVEWVKNLLLTEYKPKEIKPFF